MIQHNENQSGGIVAGDGQAARDCWACGQGSHPGRPCATATAGADQLAAAHLAGGIRSLAEQYADATEQQLRASLEAEGVDVDELIRDNTPAAPELAAAGDVDQADDDQDELETYAAMFDAYLVEQRLWIGAPHKPLVHHIRKLCRRLDSDPEASASMSSSYLQAITRLERMRPGSAAPKPGAGDQLGGQTSIFDELED